MNNHPICAACGTQFPLAQPLADLCPICNDDRQYIGDNGQQWTDSDQLKKDHKIRIEPVSENLYSLKIEPGFAIGQRAFLILAPGGNILWDCIPLLDEETISFIKSKGGLKAIAFSHPHFYSNMNDWAEVFDCPIYIHQSDKEFIFNHGPHIQLWGEDRHQLWDNITLHNIGGHFPGSSVMQVPSLSPKGSLFCGDTFFIAPSKRFVAVLYSYPNRIMLSRKEFIKLHEKSEGLKFDTMHCATFDGQSLFGNAHEVFTSSMKNYLERYEIG